MISIDYEMMNAGRYGGLSRFRKAPIKRLNGKSILRLSLGMQTGTTASSWTHPPIAPPFRNSLRKILKNFLKRNNREVDFHCHREKENRMVKWKCYKSLKKTSKS